MRSNLLTLMLVGSVGLNAFLLAGGIAGLSMVNKHKAAFRRPAPAMDSWTQATASLTPDARDRLLHVIKDAALSGEDDMDMARDLREQSVKVATADPYQAATVLVLSEQARSIEVMSRSKIEVALIEDMARLPAFEREVIATHFLRPTFRFRKFLDADARLHSYNSSAISQAQ